MYMYIFRTILVHKSIDQKVQGFLIYTLSYVCTASPINNIAPKIIHFSLTSQECDLSFYTWIIWNPFSTEL